MQERILTAERLASLFAPRPRACHKGTFGTVGLFGGCVAYSGAAKLANLAVSALRAGCGIARLAVPDCLTDAVLPYLLESTLCPMPTDADGGLRYDESALERLTAGLRAIGVGMGWEPHAAQRAYLEKLLQRKGLICVADAGALTVLSRARRLLADAEATVVLTPHPGEFAALTDTDIAEIVAAPRPAAEAFAAAYGCLLLLKGDQTVVTDGQETYLVDRGGAGMATGGSGDVLTGVLTGLLGYLPPTVETVAAAATLAGIAGEIAEERMTDIAMIASDTVAALPEAIRRIRAGTA